MTEDSNAAKADIQFLVAADTYTLARKILVSSGYEAEEARATARLLLDDILATRHTHLLTPERILTEAEQERFNTLLARLQTGEPLPYVLGVAPFYGLMLCSDARGLIPRPETELLVETALQKLRDVTQPRVADLGTGSGAIALAIAHERLDAEVWATDLSADARALARENAQLLGLDARVHIMAGASDDWAVQLPRGVFDVVLSNPPYIATADIETLQQQVRDYEPHSALVGGRDGLNPYRLIAQQCEALLKQDGFIACELGAGQFADVQEIFEAQGWTIEPPLFDFAGIARVLCATR